jgi:hypothetical protein
MAQEPPPEPQADVVSPGWQMSFSSQQPLGHVLKLQVEPWQVEPMQLSPGPQAVQARPPVPQSFTVLPIWHSPLWSQQPLGHVMGLHDAPWHDPAIHRSPAGQVTHELPPKPQSPGLWLVWQTPFWSQQPCAHVAGPHPPQLPPSHTSIAQRPSTHAASGPQFWHRSPPTPQAAGATPPAQVPSWAQHPGQFSRPHV